MRALVTGSAGFLGSHVCQALTEAGIEVTGFDLNARPEASHEQRTGDLLELSELRAAAEDHDVICHIGAIGDVYLAGEKPDLAASVNAVGSANVASVASDVGAKVVYASTWEVYGEPHYEPVDETHPCSPDHPYNITKLAGERLLLAADKLSGVPTVALRLGTAYGLGMRSNSVFEIFIRKARAGEPLTIQGDGSQGRQFTHSRDIARAFVMAAQSDVRGVALNIVAPEMVTIKQLAERVIQDYPTEVQFGEARPGDIPPSFVTAERAGELLGWSAKVDFEEGMAELLEAHRDI